MKGIFYKGLILFFSLALSLSVAAWLRSRQGLKVESAANESLRKTLGEMTIAIAAKDRQIDRLAQDPCESSPRKGDGLQ